MNKHWDHTGMRNTAGDVFCRVPLVQGETACSLCQGKWQLAHSSYYKPKARGISQSEMWWRRERERCSVCPVTPCGARQMSVFSRQLFTAMQSVGHWRMNDNVRFVLFSPPVWRNKRLLSFLGDLPGVSRPGWGGVLLGVGEDGQRCVFSRASLRADACFCPHPKVSSSYISHRATCEYEKKRAFSHVRAV